MIRAGQKRLMRISAAPSPAESASAAAHRKTSPLNTSPWSRIARYSQNIERLRDCFSASDKASLFPILGEKLAQPFRLRCAEDLRRRALFLDHALMQEDHAV